MKSMPMASAVFSLMWLAGCGGTPAVESQVATSIPQAVAPTAEPAPTPSGPIAIGTLLDQSLTLNITHATGIKIESLAIGSNDEKFAIDYQGDTIYQLMEDGRLVKHLRFPGVKMDFFNVAPDGSFWFVNNLDWGLYHAQGQEPPTVVAHEMNRMFDFDSLGNLLAVDLPSDNVQKITPDGSITTIASGFQSQRIGVGPDDSVYVVTYNGELARLEADGSLNVLATGFMTEDAPAFAPDGSMYVVNPDGLRKVDLSTGHVEPVGWFDRYRGIIGTLVFDHQGIGYIFHPIQPLYRMDLQAQTVEMVYSPYGNTWALGVDPLTEDVYAAYGDRLPGGKTSLFHVEANGDLREIATVPYGIELAMTFAEDGTGYLSVVDNEKGAMLYSFGPGAAPVQEFQRPDCWAQGIAAEPGTGALWWTECNKIASLRTGQAKQTIPYLEELNNSTLTFGQDGALYALAWLRAPEPHLPMAHGIYRYESGSWVQLKDMTAKDPGITLAELAMCPDGHLYVAASIDGEDVTPGRDYSSMSALLRLEDDNNLSLIGYDLGSFDPLAITCAPSGTVYFSNAQGIYNIPGLGARP